VGVVGSEDDLVSNAESDALLGLFTVIGPIYRFVFLINTPCPGLAAKYLTPSLDPSCVPSKTSLSVVFREKMVNELTNSENQAK
jgi:hypothetical protein